LPSTRAALKNGRADADDRLVKGIEKITAVRLAEILTERAIMTSEVISDALCAQDRHGESFVQVMISGGHITEWDLAKIVAENFNLPFLLASNYQISDEAKKRFPKELLWKHLMVPLDVLDDIVCVSMPVMMTFEEMNKIQREQKCELFPYVGLITENKRTLAEMDKGFRTWMETEQLRREADAKKRSQSPSKGGDWMSIFDAGDQATKDVPKKKAAAAPAAEPKPKKQAGS
jgi:hypothetical protein